MRKSADLHVSDDEAETIRILAQSFGTSDPLLAKVLTRLLDDRAELKKRLSKTQRWAGAASDEAGHYDQMLRESGAWIDDLQQFRSDIIEATEKHRKRVRVREGD